MGEARKDAVLSAGGKGLAGRDSRIGIDSQTQVRYNGS
jgi:hypothetical protein